MHIHGYSPESSDPNEFIPGDIIGIRIIRSSSSSSVDDSSGFDMQYVTNAIMTATTINIMIEADIMKLPGNSFNEYSYIPGYIINSLTIVLAVSSIEDPILASLE